jgi:hypothetical protein
MDLEEIGYEGVGSNHLTEDREKWWALLNIVMNLRIL